MSENLVIVESPAKAKTIEKFLGKGYLVKSCYGHVRDLQKDKLSVDVEDGYQPQYTVPKDKVSVIKDLKKDAKKANTVWLATDEDREGEAISWHLAEALELDKKKIKRIVFHEITKPAIDAAIQNPRSIDENLVSAQQARRILDRLVGFEISPILWRKVRPSLSAGRVQSVAVRLVVEREREIHKFKPENHFRVSAEFGIPGKKAALKASLPHKFKTLESAKAFLSVCKDAAFSINNIEVKPTTKKPAPPFTTSTLQQEAARKLSFSVSRTMTLAQRLYEAGHITYMRTDSVNISKTAQDQAEAEISTSYGKEYSKRRQFTTKSKGAQEAHECIRPTYIETRDVPMDAPTKKLYELIRKRTLASQMADAKLEKTNVYIGLDAVNASAEDVSRIEEDSKKVPDKHQFLASGEVVKFEGFLKVYLESRDDEEDEDRDGSSLLPPVEKGQKLLLNEAHAIERFSRPPARYTEASLVKKLEEMGIGRPSTYAPTISTIMKRGYVLKETRPGKERMYYQIVLKDSKIEEKHLKETFGAEKNKLFPSDIGMVVNDFLIQYFDNILDYNFTAKVEKEFDEIAEGKKVWQKMIDNFYNPFHKAVEKTLEESQRVKGQRELGTDPETGKKIYGKIGKYGPYAQLGEGEDDEKPRFAKLRPGQLIENLTLEDALKLFQLPREVGEFEGLPMTVNIGRFGPYVFHNKKFYSLPPEEDPYEIKAERAAEVVAEAREHDRKRQIQTFTHEDKEMRVLNGKFGPYVSFKGKNYKIPKDKEPEKLTLNECLEIIEKKGTKGKKPTAKKATTKSKTTKGTAKKKTTAGKKRTVKTKK